MSKKNKQNQVPANSTVTKEVKTPDQIRKEAKEKAHIGIEAGTHRGVRCVTVDNIDFVNLLGISDQLFALGRAKMSTPNSRFRGKDFDEYVDRFNAIKEALNVFNADLANLVGKKYFPPRNFVAPKTSTWSNNPNEKAPKTSKVPSSAPTDAPVIPDTPVNKVE